MTLCYLKRPSNPLKFIADEIYLREEIAPNLEPSETEERILELQRDLTYTRELLKSLKNISDDELDDMVTNAKALAGEKIQMDLPFGVKVEVPQLNLSQLSDIVTKHENMEIDNTEKTLDDLIESLGSENVNKFDNNVDPDAMMNDLLSALANDNNNNQTQPIARSVPIAKKDINKCRPTGPILSDEFSTDEEEEDSFEKEDEKPIENGILNEAADKSTIKNNVLTQETSKTTEENSQSSTASTIIMSPDRSEGSQTPTALREESASPETPKSTSRKAKFEDINLGLDDFEPDYEEYSS